MTFLVIVHALVCIFLVAVILIQPGKGDAGIGFGSSSSQSIFGSRAGNFLTKTTSVVAVIFLATSFFLTRDRMQAYNSSVIGDETPAAQSTEAPETPAAGEPAKAPAAGDAGTPAQEGAKSP